MCRLYGFRANEDTRVECSLVHAENALLMQSRSDMTGRAHPDGWGIAFYQDTHPNLERRSTAAFDDLHFSSTAGRINSQTVVAHVRLASVGGLSDVNSHPFTYGQWTFAHNGTVRGFEILRDELIAETLPSLNSFRQGFTDSEHCFYWLLSRLARAGIDLTTPVQDTNTFARVISEAVAQLDQRCRDIEPDETPCLNFLITEGQVLAVTRWNNSLYWVAREGVHDCEVCGIPHVQQTEGTNYRAAIVASEPVSQEAWQEVPNHHLLLVDADIRVGIHAIEQCVSECPGARSILL